MEIHVRCHRLTERPEPFIRTGKIRLDRFTEIALGQTGNLHVIPAQRGSQPVEVAGNLLALALDSRLETGGIGEDGLFISREELSSLIQDRPQPVRKVPVRQALDLFINDRVLVFVRVHRQIRPCAVPKIRGAEKGFLREIMCDIPGVRWCGQTVFRKPGFFASEAVIGPVSVLEREVA